MAKAVGMVFRKSGNRVPKATVATILHKRIYTGDFDFDGATYSGRYKPITLQAMMPAIRTALDRRTA
jgi:hypothetical protein